MKKSILFLLSVIVFSAAETRTFSMVDAPRSSERVKRQSGTTLIESLELTVDEINFFLDDHNRVRRLQNATNMRLMEWDGELAAFAHDYVQNCDFTHSQSPYGENLYAIFSNQVNRDAVRRATQSWYNETEHYDFESNSCAPNEICGHYTQMVWADTYRLGCGAALCASERPEFDEQLIVSCNYLPPGNFIGRQPYEAGNEPCSTCEFGDDEGINCVDGLCEIVPRVLNNLTSSAATQSPTTMSSTQPPTTSSTQLPTIPSTELPTTTSSTQPPNTSSTQSPITSSTPFPTSSSSTIMQSPATSSSSSPSSISTPELLSITSSSSTASTAQMPSNSTTTSRPNVTSTSSSSPFTTSTESTSAQACSFDCRFPQELVEAYQEWRETYTEWKRIFEEYNENYRNQRPLDEW